MKHVLALLLVAGLLLFSTRSAVGDAATIERLLERGLRELTDAEDATKRNDLGLAKRFARAAEGTFRAALDMAPQETRAAFLGGQAAVFARDLTGARAWTQRFESMSPYGNRDPDVHYLRALVDVQLANRPDLAIQSLRRMQALNPRVRPAQRDLLMWNSLERYGLLLVRSGDPTLAQRQFLTAERIARRMGHERKVKTSRANYAFALQRDNRHAEAQAVYEGLQKNEPNNAVWNLYLGLCLGEQHQFAAAIPFYERAIANHIPGKGGGMDKDLLRARMRVGNCYRIAGQGTQDPKRRAQLMDKAQEWLKKYIALAPKEPLGYLWMGTLFFEDLEKPYEALPYYEKAFALDELCVEPLSRLIQIHELFPPPTGADGKPTMSVTEWKAPLAAWKKNHAEGKKRRRAALKVRSETIGFDGCR